MELSKLKEPMPYKWKPQTCGEYGSSFVGYVDARLVMDRLDEVCGQANWKTEYSMVGNLTICTLSIKVGDEWIGKADVGTESDMEKDKGLISDSFKRSAVHWGIGRFLYSLGIVKAKAVQNQRGKWVPSADGKNVLWPNQYDEYCQTQLASKGQNRYKAPADPPKGKTDVDLARNLAAKIDAGKGTLEAALEYAEKQGWSQQALDVLNGVVE